MAIAGGGEIVGVGDFQESGLRSVALWAITPGGVLDRGVDTRFAGPSTGIVRRYSGFGPRSDAVAPPGPDSVPSAARGTNPAKLAVLRARVRGRKLDLLALITQRASGRIGVRFDNNGTTTRFSVKIPSGTPIVRIRRSLTRAARKGHTGIVTLTYKGNDRVRRDRVRLRAAGGRALLRRKRSQIDRSGFLVVSGTVAKRAHGLVRVRLEYLDGAQRARTLEYRAKIRRGRWLLEAKLPDAAALAGGQLSIRFTGDLRRAIRGEQVSKALQGQAGGTQLRARRHMRTS